MEQYKKEFQFGISEPSKKKASKILFKKIGEDAYRRRFEVRKIKDAATKKEIRIMRKPQGYDNLQVSENGGKQLPAGGYICEIVGVREQKSKAGKDMIVVAVDILEGECKGFFKQRFDANTNANKQWPNGAVSYILLEDKDGNTNESFKKFTTFVEKSNNFNINWDGSWDQFKKKKIGVTFRREQFQGDKGLAFTIKIAWLNTVETIKKGVEAPADKLLDLKGSSSTGFAPSGFTPTMEDDDDLPF